MAVSVLYLAQFCLYSWSILDKPGRRCSELSLPPPSPSFHAVFIHMQPPSARWTAWCTHETHAKSSRLVKLWFFSFLMDYQATIKCYDNFTKRRPFPIILNEQNTFFKFLAYIFLPHSLPLFLTSIWTCCDIWLSLCLTVTGRFVSCFWYTRQFVFLGPLGLLFLAECLRVMTCWNMLAATSHVGRWLTSSFGLLWKVPGFHQD